MLGDRLRIDAADLVIDFHGRSTLVADEVERAAREWTASVSAWVEPDVVRRFHLEGEGIRWQDDGTVEVSDGATIQLGFGKAVVIDLADAAEVVNASHMRIQQLVGKIDAVGAVVRSGAD